MDTIRVDPQAYRDFLTHLDLDQIYIKSLTAVRHQNIKGKGTITIECGPKSHDIQENLLSVEFGTSISGKHYNTDEEVFSIEVTYEAVYTLEQEPSDSQFVKLFVNNNVFVHVWPFVRELANNLSYRMNLPPITLSVKVTDL